MFVLHLLLPLVDHSIEAYYLQFGTINVMSYPIASYLII